MADVGWSLFQVRYVWSPSFLADNVSKQSCVLRYSEENKPGLDEVCGEEHGA